MIQEWVLVACKGTFLRQCVVEHWGKTFCRGFTLLLVLSLKTNRMWHPCFLLLWALSSTLLYSLPPRYLALSLEFIEHLSSSLTGLWNTRLASAPRIVDRQTLHCWTLSRSRSSVQHATHWMFLRQRPLFPLFVSPPQLSFSRERRV